MVAVRTPPLHLPPSHKIEQLVTSEHMLRPFHEGDQQVEFGGAQMDQ